MQPAAKKTPPAAPAEKLPPREHRINLDLSHTVYEVLMRISDTLGVPKSQVVVQALVEALPRLVERAEGLEAAIRRGKK